MRSISDQMSEEARRLFAGFDAPKKQTLMWHYLHARIEAIQDQGRPVPDRFRTRLSDLEDELEAFDITPSQLLQATEYD